MAAAVVEGRAVMVEGSSVSAVVVEVGAVAAVVVELGAVDGRVVLAVRLGALESPGGLVGALRGGAKAGMEAGVVVRVAGEAF